MPIITNAGKTFLAKINSEAKGTISLGFNCDGTIRRYEDGELIKEFSSIDEYSEWVKLNRPDEYCPGNETV